MPKTPKKLRPVTINPVGELGRGILEIMENTEFTTARQVVMEAIIVYHTLMRLQEAGGIPQVVMMENGKVASIIPIFKEQT